MAWIQRWGLLKLHELSSIRMLIKVCIQSHLKFAASFSRSYNVCTENFLLPRTANVNIYCRERWHKVQWNINWVLFVEKRIFVNSLAQIQLSVRPSFVFSLLGEQENVPSSAVQDIFHTKCQLKVSKSCWAFLRSDKFHKIASLQDCCSAIHRWDICNSCEWKSLVISCRSYVQTM